MIRRSCISVALLHAIFCVPEIHAQESPDQLPAGYPVRPIHIVVGVPAGGGIDAFMRVFAQKLADRWKRGVVVDNHPGASSLIAMQVAANAAPDGYTLLAGTNAILTNMLLGKVPFDIRSVYVPVIKLTSQPYLLVVNNTLPVKSVRDLVALAKSKPGSLSYASSGVGSVSHLGMEQLKYMAGIELTHVPYKGVSAGVTDLIGGRIQMMFSISITAMPLIKNGNAKAIAVTSLQRSREFQDLPTISESGVSGYTLVNEYFIYAPAGTPAAMVASLNKAGNAIMNTAEMKAKLDAEGMEAAAPNTPSEFKSNVDQDLAKLGAFIKASGFKGE